MGGGGSSGAVRHGAHIERFHSMFMYGGDLLPGPPYPINQSAVPPDGFNIIDRVMGGNGQTSMIGNANNPYFGVAAYGPGADLQAAVTELNDLEAILDTANMQNQILERDVSFKDRHKFNLAQSYNRVTAVMAGTGAAMGTAFPTALALLEVSFNNDIKEAKIQAESTMLKNKADAVRLRLDYLRNKIAIKTDQNRQDVTYNSDEAFWDLTVYLRALSAISVIAGVAQAKKEGEPGKMQSVMGGLATGASIGAMTPMPLVGAGVGAGVGGLLGLFG